MSICMFSVGVILAVFCGADVSKHRLDFHRTGPIGTLSLANDSRGIGQFEARFAGLAAG